MRAECCRLFREPDAFARVVTTGALHDAGPVADRGEHSLEQIEFLSGRRRRRLAGGPGDHQPVTPAVHELHGEFAGPVQVELSIDGERGNHGNTDSPERETLRLRLTGGHGG